ncbi:MAG TPA: iron-containing alcohol dehydrogenase [Defluviitaleaceae bacterium]|nr:iron-containing alcohol dehydrogenase [Candidatus Epulonipiscium sp.]HOQ17511.1 iron-containing alcohol dehydrogenase [Defluviitaleaceae bacterium]HQD50116.1 iron-containing alcohol dehydrogenase [Defluviitaleaceae bacterium]
MDNFVFYNPTKIIFGIDTENQVGEEVARYSKKILFVYGGGSIKRTGLYDRIVASLRKSQVEFIELPGVKPNPRLSLVREGIKICRDNQLDFILAVGGGSTIDTAKAIAIGVPYDGDVWDFYSKNVAPQAALPVGTVLTIPAAGSESSDSSVITNEEGWYKRGVGSELIYPKFSILNPKIASTIPKNHVAAGVADIMAHLMERYFTNTKNVELTDRLIESTMKTVINHAPVVIRDPDNYEAWSQLMWSGTVAHNNLFSTGRVGDWASHNIEHELSGIYDVAHGAGLAVVFPAWMKYVYKHDLNRFVQFAVRVWNVEEDFFNPEKTALEGIKKLEEFFISIGLGVYLEDLGIQDDRLEEMADKATNSNQRKLGNFVKLDKNDVYSILKLAKRG